MYLRTINEFTDYGTIIPSKNLEKMFNGNIPTTRTT